MIPKASIALYKRSTTFLSTQPSANVQVQYISKIGSLHRRGLDRPLSFELYSDYMWSVVILNTLVNLKSIAGLSPV